MTGIVYTTALVTKLFMIPKIWKYMEKMSNIIGIIR